MNKTLALSASCPTKKVTHKKGEEYIMCPFTYIIKPPLSLQTVSQDGVSGFMFARGQTRHHTHAHTLYPLSPSVVSTCSLDSSDFRTNQSSWPFTNRKHVESATRTAVQRRPISPSLLFPFFGYSSDRLKYTLPAPQTATELLNH